MKHLPAVNKFVLYKTQGGKLINKFVENNALFHSNSRLFAGHNYRSLYVRLCLAGQQTFKRNIWKFPGLKYDKPDLLSSVFLLIKCAETKLTLASLYHTVEQALETASKTLLLFLLCIKKRAVPLAYLILKPNFVTNKNIIEKAWSYRHLHPEAAYLITERQLKGEHLKYPKSYRKPAKLSCLKFSLYWHSLNTSLAS